MKKIIDDLKDLSGVLGACLYHGQKGILESNLPAMFTAEKLQDIGSLLMKIQTVGNMNFHDLTDLILQYDESEILVRGVGDNLIVFTLCDPGFNQSLVAMSLNLLEHELKNYLVQQAEAVPLAVVQESETTPEAVDEILAEMNTHLLNILGPMAEIIFEESVEDWKEQGKRTVEDLDSLVQMLSDEIGSEDKIAQYKKLIAPAIKLGIGGQ